MLPSIVCTFIYSFTKAEKECGLVFLGPEAEFKEFEPRLKFKPQLKYGWFH